MIQRRLKTLSQSLRPLVAEIGAHFFDSKVSITDMRQKVGGSTWLTRLLRREVGLTGIELQQECQMEMALRLLRDTSKTVKAVALGVGYDTDRALGMLCHQWCGLTPAVLRSRLRPPTKALRELPTEVLSWFFLDRLESGELTVEETRAVLDHLEHLYAASS